jgi:hypothetical protein
MPEATWKPHVKDGQPTVQSGLPDSVFAFPKQRKEPLTDPQHVRNAKETNWSESRATEEIMAEVK